MPSAPEGLTMARVWLTALSWAAGGDAGAADASEARTRSESSDTSKRFCFTSALRFSKPHTPTAPATLRPRREMLSFQMAPSNSYWEEVASRCSPSKWQVIHNAGTRALGRSIERVNMTQTYSDANAWLTSVTGHVSEG